jgi:hypothetical protein
MDYPDRPGQSLKGFDQLGLALFVENTDSFCLGRISSPAVID